MYYIRYTDIDDFLELLCEVDITGVVKREVGLNNVKRVIHKAPTDIDNYGLYDNQRFDVENLKSNITKEYFEQYWCADVDESVLRKRVVPNKIFQYILIGAIILIAIIIFLKISRTVSQ